LDEKERIQKEKDQAFKERSASVVDMLKSTYYPGHATTARRVIERHLIREFGLKPREATYHGGNIIDSLQTRGIISQAPEDTVRNNLLNVNIRKLRES
tara:strand:+ start:97 stop:390 length:294 start_codon:yes stop_codon:yes gene_type:complete